MGPARLDLLLGELQLGELSPSMSPSLLELMVSHPAVNLDLQSIHITASLRRGQELAHRITERWVGRVEVWIYKAQPRRASEQRR